MRTVIGIDPGTAQSAVVVWGNGRVCYHEILPNEDVFSALKMFKSPASYRPILVIEQIRSYGMAVGAETFDTVFWSGRFAQWWHECGEDWYQMPRMDVKMFWCKTTKAKDSNIWQAMVDRFGPVGTKKAPGMLYGVRSHERAALALAVAFAEREVQP